MSAPPGTFGRPPGSAVMRAFLTNNRDELIARCAGKATLRPGGRATPERFASGIPMFMEQLARTLRAEGAGEVGASLGISGGSESDAPAEIGSSVAAHGADLMRLGFDADLVVHCYGDPCQAVTDLVLERDAPFSIEDFRTLNRCLDNAIADAVTEFGALRDAGIESRRSAEENRRLGALAHELRNALQTGDARLPGFGSGLTAGACPTGRPPRCSNPTLRWAPTAAGWAWA